MLAVPLVLGGVAVLVALVVALRPDRALPVLVLLLPFDRLLVSAADRTLLPPPDIRIPDLATKAYLGRAYFLDLALLCGLVAGALLRALWRRRRVGPAWLVALVAAEVGGLLLINVLQHQPAGRAVVFELMLTVAGPVAMVAALAVVEPGPTAARMRSAFVAAAALIGAVALLEQVLRTALPAWLGYSTPPPSSAFFTSGHGFYRSGSLLRTPLELGFLMVAATPLALAQLLGARWRRGPAAAALALVLAGLVLTFTRSSLLAAGVAAAVVAWAPAPSRRRVRLLAAAVAVAAVVVLVLAVPAVGPFGHNAAGNSAHLDQLRLDLRAMQRRPGGWGLGLTDTIGQNFSPAIRRFFLSTENLWLAKGVEAGVAGLVLYVAVSFAVLGALLRVVLRARRRGDAVLLLDASAVLASLVGVGVNALFLGIEAVSWLVPVGLLTGAVLVRARVAAREPYTRGRIADGAAAAPQPAQ